MTCIYGINCPKSLSFNDKGDIFVTRDENYASVFCNTTSYRYNLVKIGSKGTGELQFICACVEYLSLVVLLR